MYRFAAALIVGLASLPAFADHHVTTSVSWFIDSGNDFIYNSGEFEAETNFVLPSPAGTDHEGHAYGSLQTGLLKVTMFTHNYVQRGSVDAYSVLVDTFWVETAGSRTSADAIVTMHVEGSVTMNPESLDASGNVGLHARIFGNNVDYMYPYFGDADVLIDKQPGENSVCESQSLVEGVDYFVMGDTAYVDTTIVGTHTFDIGDDPLPINWDISVGGSTADRNGNPDREIYVHGDFWYTATANIELAQGFEDFELKRSSQQAPCIGDLNGDQVIDLGDLSMLLVNFGMLEGATYYDGDLDGDGDVDLLDLSALLIVFGTSC